MKRITALIALIGLIVLPMPAGAQRMPGGTPLVDTVRLNKLKKHLKEIGRIRPTVALVLSGGGAKGASHIGVIKYLESLEIPVDVVIGTSMGGLVGGFYAAGYDSAEMERIVRNINWTDALTDKLPRDYIAYAENKYREKYVLYFPFYYAKGSAYDSMQVHFNAPEKKYDELHLGAGGQDVSKVVRDNLLGSLPSGFVFGQNVNNILSSLTVGYQDEMDFSKLPIPFLCVATEMVTGKAKIWQAGKLTTALRSTMSIPGVFAPVKVDGMVLVDGGMRDNYPTDIARMLGADIIIGVDLADGYRDFTELNNLADIIFQGVAMLGRESYERNKELTEVSIKPHLPEYNMMSFDAASIDTIMVRGYRAAAEQEENLKAVKNLVGSATSGSKGRKALNLSNKAVLVDGIEITGVDDMESLYLMGLLNLKVGEFMDKDAIEDAVATIYGTQAFDYVTYELTGEEEPFRLKINCRKGPVHRFGVGGRFDTEELVAVLVNVGLNVNKLQGSAFELTGKVGTNPYLDLHYYHMSPKGPTWNAVAKLSYVDRNQFTIGSTRFKAAYLNFRGESYLSNINWKKFDIKAGLRSDLFILNSIMAEKVSGDYDVESLRNTYVSTFITMRADNLDDGYFPSSGFSLGLDYSWVFAGLQKTFEPFHSIFLDARTVFPLGNRFSIVPSVYSRFLVGTDIPLPYVNVIGGSMRGRYLEQQIPFIGISNAMAAYNYLNLARADLRMKILDNHYVSAIWNGCHMFTDPSVVFDETNSQAYMGIGIEYAYDSIVGPFRVDVHWSSATGKLGAYIGLGFDF